MKQDLRQGKEQAKQDAQLAKEKVQEHAEGDTGTAPYQAAEPVEFESTDELAREAPEDQPSPRSSGRSL